MERLNPYKRRRDTLKVTTGDPLPDRDYLQRISDGFSGFQWFATRLVSLTSCLTRGKTELLQPYSNWSLKFLALLYDDEHEKDNLDREKCLATFDIISKYPVLPRAVCLLSAYMIAQSRLLLNAYEDSGSDYQAASKALEDNLPEVKLGVSEMHTAALVLLDAPGWTGQRARSLVQDTEKTLALLDQIESTQNRKSQSGKIWRPIERLLILVVYAMGTKEPKTRWSIVRWMRAAQAASGKYPPEIDALYKVAFPTKDPSKLSDLISRNHESS